MSKIFIVIGNDYESNDIILATTDEANAESCYNNNESFVQVSNFKYRTLSLEIWDNGEFIDRKVRAIK